MVGEVMTGAADLALADLTITAARERVVDFTVPFLQTGITVLYCTRLHIHTVLFSRVIQF